ncbi:hypothetical protein [Terrimonas alba]|uniref:hypothetical protein n=1 Tax=Terrimonas alba TaxID=3349636 RepID=UPI0035F4AB21
MKELLTRGWNFMRVLRMLVGVISIYFAVDRADVILGVAGGLFILSGVFNVGCCGTTGCNIPQSRKKLDN